MTPGILDHIMVVILAAVLPIHAFFDFRRLQREIAAGVPGALKRAYYLTIAIEWVLVAAVLALWFLSGRGLAELGLGFDATLGWWIGAAAAVVLIGLSIYQAVSAIRDSKSLAKVRKQLEPLRALIPRNAKEGQLFNAVSVTAGVCEEILYRGFLIAYFGAFVDLWLAVVLSSLAFGVAHMYQGKLSILKTGAIGLVMAGLYVLTGSLWVPIVVHAIVDITNGYMGRKALSHAAA